MDKIILSKIIDFTRILNEDSNSYCFNPSIAHWKDNLYLISYRIFLHNIDTEIKDPNTITIQ
jgi:hypothetical protein